jgi:hypothetical protein
MFHGKWLRFMSEPKSRGELINKVLETLIQQSRINFSVKLGILTHLLDKIAEQACRNQTFKLCFDRKNNNSSISDQFFILIFFYFSIARNLHP